MKKMKLKGFKTPETIEQLMNNLWKILGGRGVSQQEMNLKPVAIRTLTGLERLMKK